MLIRAVTSEGFRNLGGITLVPNPRFNVLHGENGQGKTNLLEAIYVLATLRSFRTTRLEELVRFEKGPPTATSGAQLRARVEHRQIERVFGVEIGLNPPRKQALCDGKAARTSDYFGGFNVVLFAPEDLRLPKGPPAGRRRFLDRAIWNTYPAYLDEVRTYERVLRHRNAVLRNKGDAAMQEAAEQLLAVYDERLAAAAAPLLARRRRYLNAVAPQVARAFSAISGDALEVGLRYVPSPRGALEAADETLAEVVLAHLIRDRRRDFARGFTHSGPHADDWVLDLAGRAAELHASQGQTRALVLALKIAEIEYLTSLLGDAPVLLLDDVSSELDAQKNAALFTFLRAIKSQVFITTTSPSHIQVEAGPERNDFRIACGNIAG